MKRRGVLKRQRALCGLQKSPCPRRAYESCHMSACDARSESPQHQRRLSLEVPHEQALPGRDSRHLHLAFIHYREVDGGAELTYRASDPKLVSSLHAWFDAQLSDHGANAMSGHQRMCALPR